MAKNQEVDTHFLNLAVERGYLDQEQIAAIGERHSNLNRAGVSLNLSQTLIERQFLTPEQVKSINAELRARGINLSSTSTRLSQLKPIGKFGQYIVLKEIGAQGRAHIFWAHDPVMDRYVVLKILPKSATKDAQWGERFKREIMLVAKLSHPNLLAALNAGEIDGQLVIVFQHFDGVSLAERLEHEGNIPEREAWLIALEIYKGLMHAYRNGVLHRNISPETIWCCEDGRIKIRDMGMAKAMNTGTDLTMAGTTVGAPFYMSPEQTKGTTDLDHRTDIYSLGCTVFHMLTGSVPFVADNMADVMHKHVTAPRPDPRSLLPEISEASAKLVMRLMEAKPDNRLDSPEELMCQMANLVATLPDDTDTHRAFVKVQASVLTPNGVVAGNVQSTARTSRTMNAIPVQAPKFKLGENAPPAESPGPPKVERKSAFAKQEPNGTGGATAKSSVKAAKPGFFSRLLAMFGMGKKTR